MKRERGIIPKRCPVCGSTAIKRIIYLGNKIEWTCKRCSYKWSNRESMKVEKS